MNALILAAGFATRLYPLTRDFPKPLIEIGGQTIIDRLLSQIRTTAPDEIVVVCNRRFERHFRDWRPHDVRLVVNDAQDDASRLGAVGDLALALGNEVRTDHLVAAADNLFDVHFSEVVDHFKAQQRSTVCVWRNPDKEDRRRRGNALIGDGHALVAFEEKPAVPRSEWSSAPLYVYRGEDLARIQEYLVAGGNPDAPGHFVAWLSNQSPMSAFTLSEVPVDIGNHEALARARALYTG